MYGFIYITTNLINGKKYIGKRKCTFNEYDDSYLGSGKLLLQAVEKYGKSNFSREIKCVETGEVFDSLRKAASKYGVPGSASNICNCLNGKQETAFDMHWKRI